MLEAVIIDAVRTPIGRRNGMLSGLRPDDMASEVLKEIINRTGVSPELIDDIIMGCVSQVGEQAGDIARLAGLIAGFPISVPGTTIDRQCGSSQQAIHFAAQAIISGDMDIVLAAGVESMSRVPMFSNLAGTGFSESLTAKYEMHHQGIAAERIAEIWGLSREQLDEYSLESHEKAITAQKEGRFDREIMPLKVRLPEGETKIIKQDSGPRQDTTIEKLGQLKPSFIENGKIHAGNSSQISDGAAAALIMSNKKAKELGISPRFRIVNRTVVGSDPSIIFTGPIIGTNKALVKAGLNIDNIDIFEINEAFAPAPLIWLQETGADPKKLNPNGGAIALGHPLGATGVRILSTMMSELDRIGGRFGLIGMCESHGMANVTIIERL
ncbi:thiolase family protein [Peribacillus glennii]|uniref:Thiolase family protein n=1 Tax=Peribacillus glennii TaxID=2303991 RepID=A0A372LHB2_9BACI|nr:thiolase family protein [Peribacillus glennii]RFU65006.1 thiolase family protein [Peribacillus glennii]